MEEETYHCLQVHRKAIMATFSMQPCAEYPGQESSSVLIPYEDSSPLKSSMHRDLLERQRLALHPSQQHQCQYNAQCLEACTIPGEAFGYNTRNDMLEAMLHWQRGSLQFQHLRGYPPS
jgi:hypothetical protein